MKPTTSIIRSPAAAIGWEIWRKNRWALSLVLAAIPASFLTWSVFPTRLPEIVVLFEFFAILFSLVILLWAFSFTELDARGRHSGFPSRMFVLPVRTSQLVYYPVLYGTGSILLLYFIWMGAISLQWQVAIPLNTLVCEAAVLTAMMVSAQAIAWALHRFNWTRIVLLILVTMSLGGSGLVCLDPDQSINRRTLTLVAGIVAILAYVTALCAVERDRRGEWLGGLERLCQNVLDAVPWSRRPFVSAQQAQFWLEWRRRGWLMASVLGVVMAVSLVLFPLSTALYLDPTLVLINFFILPILTLWCASSLGIQLAKSDSWSPDLTLHPITAVRPISTGDVVLAKLQVAAIVSLLGFALFVPLAFPAMQLAHGLAYLNEEVLQFWPAFPTQHRTLMHWAANPIVIFTAFGLTWSTMVNGMCPALAGRMRRNVWVVGRQLTLFGIVVLIADWLYVHQEHLPAFLQLLPWVTGGALLWKWTAAARAFRQARREGYYSRKQWWGLSGAWLLLTCGVGASGFLAYAAHQIPVPILFFLAVCLLPGGALARSAANLAENRHR